ncbi:zinc finger protein 423 homolog [Hetaerina americana]|uniref:zinc finger protein 423 homolog n=1 Tax=Hetaerina americana TaxID=62018 RepID=UPI003A7F2382
MLFTLGPTDATPYACSFCEKAFPRLSYLKKHEQTHSDQMPFRCEFCSRLFKHKRSRDRHIKLHTGDRKYRCTQCESAFSRSDHLKIHMKTHDNQKPFQCTVCNRGYNTAAALTSHMQSHKRGGGRNGGGGSTPSPGPTVLPTSPAPKAASTPTSEAATGRSSSGSRGSSPHRCTHCTAGFRKAEDLQAHMALHHSAGIQAPSPVHAETPRPRGRPPSSSLLPPRSCSASIPSPVAVAPKLACIYCTKDSFTTMEGLQLHVQAMHGSILNGDLRELAAAVGVVGALPHLGPTPVPPPSNLSPRLPSPTTSSSSTMPSSSSSASLHLLPFSCEFCTMRFDAPTALHKHALAVHAVPAVLGSQAAALSGPPLHPLHSAHHLRHPFPFVAASAPPPSLPPPPPPAPLPPPPSLPPEQVRPTDLSKKSSESRSECPEPPRAHEKAQDYMSRSKQDYHSIKNHVESKMKIQDYSLPNYPSHRLLQQQAHQFLHAAAKSPPDFLSFAKSLRDLQASVSKADFSTPRKAPAVEPKRQRTPPEGEPSSLAGTLLCNQCDAALPDFESFRSHLKTHLEDEEAAARAAASGGAPTSAPGAGGFTRRRSRKSNPHPRSGGMGGSGSPGMTASAAGPSPPAASPPPNRRTRCPECDAEFSTEAEAERHAVSAHFQLSPNGGASEFGCQSCGRRFPKPDELQKHLMDLHAHHLYRCALCKEMFDSKVSIQVHFAVKHSNECKLYRCAVCAELTPFRSEPEFVAHVRSVHLLPAWSGQRRHHSLQRQPPIASEAQQACPPTNGVAQFRCLFCHLSFPSELELQFHLTTHRKEFKCVLCEEAFHVEFLLDRHVMEAHRGHMTNGMTTTAAPTPPRQEKPLARTTPKKASAPSTPTSPQPAASALPNGRPAGKDDEAATRAAQAIGNTHPAHQVAVVSLQCAYCNERCKSRSELESHTRAMHSAAVGATTGGAVGGGGGVAGTASATGGKHKCVICDEVCATAVSLAEHKLARHCKVPEGSGCCVCKAPIGGEDEFHAHVRRHATSGSNRGGNGATATAASSSSSTSSSSSSSPPPPLPTPCVVCRQTLVSEVEVRMHARFHLRRRGSSSAAGLDQQAQAPQPPAAEAPSQADPQQVAGRERRSCCVCLRPLSDEEVVESGVEEGFPAVCTECRVLCGAAAGGGASRGVPGDDDSGPYQCIKCQRGFPTEREIRAHVLSAHLLDVGSHAGSCNSGAVGGAGMGKGAVGGGLGVPPASSDLACHLCSPPSEWDSPLRLQAHLIEHSFGAATVASGGRDSSGGGASGSVVSGGSNFSCYLCGAVFTAAAGLQRHMPGHGLAQRPYDCSRCSLRFFFRSELENHMFSHRDDEDERQKGESEGGVVDEQSAMDLGAKSRTVPKVEVKEELEPEEGVTEPCPSESMETEMQLKREGDEVEQESSETDIYAREGESGATQARDAEDATADGSEAIGARKRARSDAGEEAPPATKRRPESPLDVDCESFADKCANYS